MLGILITIANAHGSPQLPQPASSLHPAFHHYPPGSTLAGTLMVGALCVAAVTALVLFLRQRRRTAQLNKIQTIAWLYAAMFYVIASLTYIPGLADETGNFVGLFKLDLIDDLLHFGSAIWATFAAWHSRQQAIRYFKIFGTVYAADGIIGLFTQRGILDLGLFLFDRPNISLVANIGANLPHILIGSIAIYAGFYLSKKQTFSTSPSS